MINWMNQTIKWLFCGCGSQQSKSVQGNISSSESTWNSRDQEVTWSSSQKSIEKQRHSGEIERGTKVIQKQMKWSRERAEQSKSLESVQKKEKAFEAIAFEMQWDFWEKIPFVLIFLFLRQFFIGRIQALFLAPRDSLFLASTYGLFLAALYLAH